MLKLKLSLVSLIIPFLGTTQILVQNALTPAEVIQNVLLGNGITATNITYNGSSVAANSTKVCVSTFNSNGSNFPINEGVLLTTGDGQVAVGPNNSTHKSNSIGTQYITMSPSSVYEDIWDLINDQNTLLSNGFFLEFDFVATGDTISFNYMFGSEEYDEYVGSEYNDAFAFFLSGPGISGPFQNGGINLAVLPQSSTSTNIVSVNNVNAGGGLSGNEPAVNSQYFVNNSNNGGYSSAIQYDGTTVLLNAGSKVQCGETYHIKLCIVNVGDESYDSGIFLQAKSFSSNSVDAQFIQNGVESNSLVEGNSDSLKLVLTRPESELGHISTINIIFSGTAENGIDNNTIPTSVQFQEDQDTIMLGLIATQDCEAENEEFLIFSIEVANSTCANTSPSVDTLYFIDVDCPVAPIPPVAQIILVPNVFTPNGDSDNDYYFITSQNVKSMTLTILDRWGNLIFQNTQQQPMWDGRDSDGNLLSDGVYFYKYHAEGNNPSDIHEGSGFLHLIHDK